MSFSDETLMAYADGELDMATRRAVEQACSSDLALARRVAYYKTRRSNVFAGFAPADDGQRVRPPRQATVVSLQAVRARREATQLAARKATRERRWSWPEWTALGGVLVVGVLAGTFGLSYFQADDDTPVDLVASHGGTLMAEGRLVTALEQQLAAPPGAAGVATNAAARAAGAVRIGMSFVSADGSYCRSFASGSGTSEIAGLACKTGQEWRLALVMQNPRPAQSSGTAAATSAAADIAPPVRAAIEQRISGDPLDAKAEQEAMQRGWQR